MSTVVEKPIGEIYYYSAECDRGPKMQIIQKGYMGLTIIIIEVFWILWSFNRMDILMMLFRDWI